MKRILLTSLVASSVLASQAQIGTTGTEAHKLQCRKAHNANDNSVRPAPQPNTNGQAKTIPFWTEDFSGGAIPAGWVNDDVLTPTGTPVVEFVWSNVPADVAVAALGYQPSSVFNSTTGLNGYLWCNSDRGLTAAPGFDHLTQLTTTAIDCSAESAVLLSFESLIGVYDYDAATNVKVRVSTDMVTWTDFVPFPCLITGAAAPPCTRWSGNPDHVELDITSVAANQPTVYIMFEWLGGWEYFWALDDISLSPVPDYERELLFSVVSHTGFGLEYGRVPVNQLETDFNLGAEVKNRGINAQTNLTINASVTGPGGSFSASQNFATVAPGDTARLDQFVTLPVGLTEGVYTATFTVTSDQDALEEDATDDSEVRLFELDNLLYTLDGIGVYASNTLSSISTASFVDSQDDLHCFTWYPTDETVVVYGLEVQITAASVAGAQMIAALHDSATVVGANPPTDGDPYSPLIESADYTVTATDVANGYVWIPFGGGGYTVPPGGVMAGVALFSTAGATDVGVVDDATVPQPTWASAAYVPGGTPGTYSNGNALAVRLVMDPSIGIGETAVIPGFSVFPNPSTDGMFTVHTSTPEPYTITATNSLGAVVYNGQFVGKTTLNLNGVASGVYAVRVSNGTSGEVRMVTKY